MNYQKSLNILFIANDGLENITSLQILADGLRERGHLITFAVNISTTGLITTFTNFDEIESQSIEKSEYDFDFKIFELSPIEVFEKFTLKCLWKKFVENKRRDVYYEKLIQRLNPDIILVESYFTLPSIITSGIPWILFSIGAPNLFLDDKRIPPSWSGHSVFQRKEKWNEFRVKKNDLFKQLKEEFKDWYVSRGAPLLSEISLNLSSPYLNIYVYPQELDFNLSKLYPPKNWHRITHLIKSDEKNLKLEVPKQFMLKPGKLIYLQMGYYGSSDVKLMKRLIAILSYSTNKFIVSKGPLHYEYELPDNMWGLECLPQTESIKLSDLVMTCGETQTITESLFYAKPLIIMPLFGKQFDNAQRVKDNGLGIILEPYKCQVSTAFGSINNLFDDPLIQRRLSNISAKMQNSLQIKTLCALIESVNK